MSRRAQHDRRDCGNETQLRDTARAVAGDVAGDFPAPGREAEHRYIFEGERVDHRRKVVGIMIHVIALPGLARSPMPAAIVRDDPKAFVCEEERRSFPAVRAKRPTMADRKSTRLNSSH